MRGCAQGVQLAFCRRQASSAFASSGRSLRLPLSTSNKGRHQHGIAVDEAGNGGVLRFQPQAALALAFGADAVVSDAMLTWAFGDAVNPKRGVPLTGTAAITIGTRADALR